MASASCQSFQYSFKVASITVQQQRMNSVDILLRAFLSSPTTLLYLLLTTFLGFKIIPLLRSSVNRRRYPPVAGTIFHQLLHWSRLYDYMTDLSRRYKTFRLLSPINSHIYTCDPQNIEYILKTNFTNYGKGRINSENMDVLLGDGIFAVDGELWRHQRKLASHEFSNRVLRDFSSVVFRTNASKVALLISNLAENKREFDIQDLFMRATLDSIFKIGFGVELNVLSGSSEKFARAFEDSSALTLRRYVDPFWKVKRFFNVGSEAAMRRNMDVIDGFIYELIRSKSGGTSESQNQMEKNDLLSRFMREREKEPEKITDKYLRDIILNFIVAGRDTTAGTLSWFFYLLCKHPTVQERITKEVTGLIQAHQTSIELDEFRFVLTDSTLGDMQYLHAALTETLRLYPAVPLDGKECFSDDTFPDSFAVRKGDLVIYQPYPMGRMEYVWGEDAGEFKPERWLDQNSIFQPDNPYKFPAFQSGPRICLGKEFAYLQMKIFSATLLFFFKFKLSDENKVVTYRPSLTLPIDKGLFLLAIRRLQGDANSSH